ncbi:MAG: aminotransferase class V-fold PLP-dependent enzyme [Cyanobacteria bacterium HKST-UBA03]|nr:aminotransferase class V-fold PLP-dependent enzyme [Cyanobacteria bacterium HKST-UBA03]
MTDSPTNTSTHSPTTTAAALTDADVDRLRTDTPGVGQVLHFNNAGASLPPRPVLDAVKAHLDLEARIGGYEAEAEAQDKLTHTYAALARLLNCRSDEIALMENATRAWDMVFYAMRFSPGDRIVTARASYASNYIAFLHMAQRSGVEIVVLPCDETGQADVAALAAMLDEPDHRIKLIAITHVPTNGGLVNPAAEIGTLARAAGLPYLLDACQSAGQLPLDVTKLGCTMLSATGRKYCRGPRGTGFLYVRRDWIDRLDPPFLDLHAAEWVSPDRYEVRADAKRFETWEGFVAGKIGLGVAIDYALAIGLDAIAQRIDDLSNQLRQGLACLKGATVQDLGQHPCGIVTFTLQGQSPQTIQRRLAEMHRINVSTTTVSGTRLDMEARHLQDMVRASVHYYNSSAEVDRFCEAVGTLIH